MTSDNTCAVESGELEPRMVSIAKAIGNLDELIQLLRRALPRSKPWQRQLVSSLDDVDRTIQILRMTIVTGRPDVEIVEASAEVHVACRRADLALAGTRADQTTKASVRLAFDLSQRVAALLSEANSPQAV